MMRKANCIMRTFQGVDPVLMTHLFRSFFSRYMVQHFGTYLVKLFTLLRYNILRRIWKLPAHTQTAILHSDAGVQSM